MGFCGSGDTNRKKFTGYERDTETGLDFAQARYFSSSQGRFTSPDSFLGTLANPQTLNRYTYVVNNPLNSTDPTGHLPVSATGPAPGSWEGFEGPEPGDLPEHYEDEISRVKQVIAENQRARSLANESAPEHVHEEEGHSGGEATGGGEHSDPQDTQEFQHTRQSTGQRIAQNALANEGRREWEYAPERIARRNHNVQLGKNTNKCTLFIYEVLLASGVSAPLVNGMPATSDEWAYAANKDLQGWKVVTDGSILPGDVIAQRIHYSDAYGHVVIATDPRNHKSIGTYDLNGETGVIRITDFGFRVGQPVVVRRYVGGH